MRPYFLTNLKTLSTISQSLLNHRTFTMEKLYRTQIQRDLAVFLSCKALKYSLCQSARVGLTSRSTVFGEKKN